MRLDAVVAYITMTLVAQANEANISTDEQLRIWAFLGAIGGALVGSLLPSRITTKERVKRWLASFITALVCVGVAVKGFSIKLGPDEVMFAAGAIGFCAWSTLKLLNKEAPNFLLDRIRAILGLKSIDRSEDSDTIEYNREKQERKGQDDQS